MRLFILCAALAVSAAAQHTLYLSGSITKDYVVGAKLPPSGLFALTPGGWQHRGYNMPFLYGIDASDPATLLLAAGNGLIRASDGGEHWTILTGSDITELRDVAADRNAKGTIYIAHSAGIRVTHDAGATWREIGSGLHRKYTEAIRVDPRRSSVLVAGGEEGLFRTEDEGATWRLAGAAGYQILRIEVSPHDPCFWMAATQRGGLFASTDCGRTFESASAFGFGRNIYAIAFDATRPGRIAAAAWGPGVGVSEDNGKTWQVRNVGLPSTEVTAVAFDPDHPGRLYAALREEALYVSDDAGASWRKDDFDGAYITFLRFLPVGRTSRSAAGPPGPARWGGDASQRARPLAPLSPEFNQRVQTVIDAYAHPKSTGPLGYGTIAARLYLHEDAKWCSERLEEILAAGPSGDMFWMYPVTGIAYLDRGQLTPSARTALRKAWQTYMPYRGDTENHFLLYYTSLYLMAQLYPDDGPDTWYTGKSSRANLEESRQWIESWIRLTTRRGQGEYDSPHYMSVFLIPMSYLAAWAKDPEMKQRAAMMLDYLIADYAPENLGGTFVGAQSRVYDAQLFEKSSNVANEFGWLCFGFPSRAPGWTLWYALSSAYEPPDILKHIATDRSRPYTHYERKRTRNRWRFNDELHGPVFKTTYVRREYAVGSDQGGILQPIQQHSWDVTWSVPDQRGVHNTFFTLHPYSSMRELQTYFVFSQDTGIEDVVRSKKMYDSPDKFSGGSPYEQIVQDRDTLIALYDVAAGARFPHINGFFSKDLAELREDASGWIFMRGGDALIACRPLQPYSWKPIQSGGKRLFSPYLKNGVVVQVASASEYPDLDGFRRAILALPLTFTLNPAPSVHFRSLRGTQIDFTYGETPKLDGRPVDYGHWPLFGGPFLESAVDSEVLTIKYGDQRRVLDFKNLKVIDR